MLLSLSRLLFLLLLACAAVATDDPHSRAGLGLEPGQAYVFSYTTDMSVASATQLGSAGSGAEASSIPQNELSEMRMVADVTVHVLAKEEAASAHADTEATEDDAQFEFHPALYMLRLEFSHVRVGLAGNGDVPTQVPTGDFASAMTTHPFAFSMRAGHVEDVWAAVSEHPIALNVKRGVASLLQLKLTEEHAFQAVVDDAADHAARQRGSLLRRGAEAEEAGAQRKPHRLLSLSPGTRVFSRLEHDVLGACESTYDIQHHGADAVRVSRTRDVAQCSGRLLAEHQPQLMVSGHRLQGGLA